MIDRSWLTAAELEELRRALVTYKAELEKAMRGRNAMIAKADSEWRLFVVAELLRQLTAP